MKQLLLLTGFMGAGKTTVGRALAEAANVPWIDQDQALEAELGMTIGAFFAEKGEAAFRERERVWLQAQLADPSPRVISLGGGALVSRELRLEALERACVVNLQIDFKEAQRRAESSGRPLFTAGGAHARTLFELRAPGYAEAHGQVSTSGASLEEVVAKIQAIWADPPVVVALGEQTYRAYVGQDWGALNDVVASLQPSGVMGCFDSNTWKLFGSQWQAAHPQAGSQIWPAGEEHKVLSSVAEAWSLASRVGLDRSSLMVGIGGGVVTDMAGFAASGWMRGTRWLSVTTTLLGMVDASVGGKTGVDLGSAKNCIGAFHQPAAVFANVSACKTLKERDYRSGLAEVIKTALVGDGPLLDYLEGHCPQISERDPDVLEELVRRSIRVKARIVSRDVAESGLRAQLNLGHTLGHALEAAGGFQRFTHGEAVGLGLLAALGVAEGEGWARPGLRLRIKTLLEALQLPFALHQQDLETALSFLGLDKKRRGRNLAFIWVEEPGRCHVRSMAMTDLTEAFRHHGADKASG